jgi:hypothetical protein
MKQAIEYILRTTNYTLFYEGSNFAQFISGDDMPEMMFDYSKNNWLVYIETGKAIAPRIKELFRFTLA